MSERFKTLLNDTVAVLLPSTVTVCDFAGTYLSMLSSVTVYLPGTKSSIWNSPLLSVVTILFIPLPETLNFIPLTILSSDVFISLRFPSGVISALNETSIGS